MKYFTQKRTIVKSIIYRIWVLITSYIMFVITGQGFSQALIPTIIINVIWMIGYYVYERIWININWGIEERNEKR